MSSTYSAVCDDCKEKCWVGQGDYLYTDKYVAEFFYRHVGHKMSFINDLADDEFREPYKEFSKFGLEG